MIKVRPIGENIEENGQDQNLSYYLILTKTVDHISKYVFPSCYVIFTLIYVIIFFGEMYSLYWLGLFLCSDFVSRYCDIAKLFIECFTTVFRIKVFKCNSTITNIFYITRQKLAFHDGFLINRRINIKLSSLMIGW